MRPQSLPEQLAPSMGVLGFAYTEKITNTGDITAQLISRTRKINDANGVHEKGESDGVVGKQPTLAAGESFEYTSGCRLRTPTGTMHGQYHCVADDGTFFDADIPMFVLDAISSLGGRRTLH